MNICALASVLKRFPNSTFVGFIGPKERSLVNIVNLVKNVLIVPRKRYSEEVYTNQTDLNKPVLRLLTKDNCSLCEESKSTLFSDPGGYNKRLVLEEVDILKEGNEELFDLYRYEIPVFFLGRKFISKNKLDLEKLDQALKKLESKSSN